MKAPFASLLCLALVAPSVSAQSSRFTEATYWSLQRVESPDIAPDGKHLLYTSWSADRASNRWVGTVWQMDADGDNPIDLAAGYAGRWSPDGSRIAYLTEIDGRSQLVVRNVVGGATRAITRASDSPESFRWSPDGKQIAFTQWVSSLSDPASAFREAIAKNLPGAAPDLVATLRQAHDHAGGDRRQLFVVAVDGGEPKQITRGALLVGAPRAGAVTANSFSWFPDNRNIAFEGSDSPNADIEFHRSAIHFVDVTTGAVGRLTATEGFWHAPAVSGDGRWIAYAGFMDNGESYRPEALWITSIDGKTTRSLTPGLERDPVSVIWAPDNQSLWFSAEELGSINIYNVTMANPSVVKMVTNGFHSLALGALSSKDGGYGLAVRSLLLEPAEIVRFALKKPAELKTITKVNQGALASLRMGEVEELSIKGGAVPIQAQLFRPPSFDASRKYPLLVEVHSGPHAMFAAAFDPAVNFMLAADYLVLRVNTRGSTGSGLAFGNAVAGGYPGVEAEDILAAVSTVLGVAAVDSGRIYLDGCGAGAMTVLQLLTATTRFARASLRCTGGEWLPIPGAERPVDFDTPFFSRSLREDPLVWAEHSPLRYASAVRTPALILGGACELDAPFGVGRSLHAALQLRRVESVLLDFQDECGGTTSRPANWVKTMRARVAWYEKR